MTWVNDTNNASTLTGTFGGLGSTAGKGFATINGFQAQVYGAESNDANAQSFPTANLADATGWQPLISVYATAASRTLYWKNGNSVINTTTLAAPESFNVISLGDYATNDATRTSAAPGSLLMAEFAIWRCALGPAEVSLLQEGVSPLRVRSEALFCYFPLQKDLFDDGPLRLTLRGPLPQWGAHPPVTPIRLLTPRLRSIAPTFTLGPQLVWMD